MERLTLYCREDLGSNLKWQKVETLVTIMVYLKDVTLAWRFWDSNDFEWQKQTRVYWKQELDHCMVSITDWDQIYAYEYLGAK